MNASSASLTRLGRTKSLVLVALVAAFGMLALAGTSKAAPVDHDINFDNGRLTLGAVFPDNEVIPAPVMGSHCPAMQAVNPGAFVPPADPDDCGPSPLSALLPNYPDGNAHIKVSVDGSTAKVEAADFKAPMTYVPNPGDTSQMVPIRVSAPNGLNGTWDAGTGELDLTGDMRITVYTGADTSQDYPGGPIPIGPGLTAWPLMCQIDAPNTKWSTGLNAVTPGIAFNSAQGLDGKGAISAQWADLPNGQEIPSETDRPDTQVPDPTPEDPGHKKTIVHSGDCSTVNAVIHDTGAIWFGAGEATPPPAPKCEPPLEGLWPDCELPPAVKKAKITKVKVGKAKVKAGKKTKITIRVTNKGNAAFNGKIALKSNKKTVKIAKSVKIKVAAGKTKAVKVVVRTTKKAKGKATITAKAGGKTGKGKVTVQKAKKKKRK